jgi:hypothetical protein
MADLAAFATRLVEAWKVDNVRLGDEQVRSSMVEWRDLGLTDAQAQQVYDETRKVLSPPPDTSVQRAIEPHINWAARELGERAALVLAELEGRLCEALEGWGPK